MTDEANHRAANITALIHGMQRGDLEARDGLVDLVYQELRERAARELQRQGGLGNITFEPTALVNEVWLRIHDRTGTWSGRDHFLAVAATAMRNLLIDHARRRRAAELSGDPTSDPLEALVDAFAEERLDLLALNEALEDLAVFDPEAARLVELRYFAGATAEEAAETCGLALRTASRRHDFAKKWIKKRMEREAADE